MYKGYQFDRLNKSNENRSYDTRTGIRSFIRIFQVGITVERVTHNLRNDLRGDKTSFVIDVKRFLWIYLKCEQQNICEDNDTAS